MELLTVEEVAAFLKVQPRAVYEMSRRRSQLRQAQPLPTIRLHKKCLRVEKQALIDWVNQVAQRSKTN